VAPVVAAHQDVRVETGTGEMRTARLPDGSRVTLGPESRVRYRASFFRDVPELTVVGQVSIDVRGPLDVHAAAARIRATSGRVGIAAYPDDGEVRVTAVDSSVRVAAYDSAVVWTVVAGTTVHVIDSAVVFRPAGEAVPLGEAARIMRRWYGSQR
jgi:ferric-dicitrate binding protein FerR (iron transport regulator)